AALRLLAEAVPHARRPRAARRRHRPFRGLRRARHASRRLPGLSARRCVPRRLREPPAPAWWARSARRVLSVRERQTASTVARPPGPRARLSEGRERMHERVHRRPVIVGAGERMRRIEPLLLLAVLRLTLGALFVWVFFENLGKDLY